jgi:hypothetical protein
MKYQIDSTECVQKLFIVPIAVKILFGWIFNIVFQASSYLQVIWTSTDPHQQFSAPFKVVNSRQAQACYIP